MGEAGYTILCCLMFFNIGGSGGNHLLDYVPSDYYWKSKNIEMTADTMLLQLQPPPPQDVSGLIATLASDNPDERAVAARQLQAIGGPALPQLQTASQSDDPGVASLATTLINQINTASKPTAVRRLMAIRALGELKDTAAIPVLAKLLTSTQPMVGDYANRSIARIHGKPLSHDDAAILAARHEDLAILPADTGAAGQASADLDDFPHNPLVKFLDSTKLPPRPVPRPGGQGFVMENSDNAKVREQVLHSLLQLAESSGDIRFDFVTFGVADKVGNNTGWGAIVFHGVYDSTALAAAMPPEMKQSDVNGFKVYAESPNSDFAIIPASDNRLIFMGGARADVLPVDSITAAIKTGKGTFADDAALNKITKTIDTDSPLWAAANISDSFRPAPVLGNLQTLTLVGKRGDKGLALSAVGTAANPQEAQAASGALSGVLGMIAGILRNDANMGGGGTEMADFLSTVKCASNGATMTADGNFTPAAAYVFLYPMTEFAAFAQDKTDQPAATQP